MTIDEERIWLRVKVPWEIDDMLADQIEAWLGCSVVRDHGPLPVDLDKLAGILDFAGYSPQRQRLIGCGRCVRSPEPGRMRSRKSRTVGLRRARAVETAGLAARRVSIVA